MSTLKLIQIYFMFYTFYNFVDLVYK